MWCYQTVLDSAARMLHCVFKDIRGNEGSRQRYGCMNNQVKGKRAE